MRILHCLDHYMPMHMAGTEIYVHTLALEQKKGGHEVSVLIPHFEFYNPGKFTSSYIFDGIIVYQYMELEDPRNRALMSGQRNEASLLKFREVLEAVKPDVIHFHEFTRSIGLSVHHIKIAKSTCSKVIFTMHLSGYTCNTNNLIKGKELCNGKIEAFTCSVCSLKTFFGFPGVLAKPVVGAGIMLRSLGLTGKLMPGKLTTLLSMPASIVRIKQELLTVAKYTDKLVTLSEWYKQILIDNGVPADKIAVVPQALSIVGTPIDKTSLIIPVKPLRIAFVGRIQHQKGVHLLVEALKAFMPEQVVLDIYGKEEDSDYYRQCRTDSKELKNVNWKGAIARDQVLSMLKNYHLLCLPSAFSEMSPLVVQEAFAAGIPVLASKVYGNAEQIKHGWNGLLFDFNSADSLQRQIANVVAHPEQLEQLKNNITPPRTFDWVSNAYLELYN